MKCVFLLLQRLFYGVTSIETTDTDKNTCASNLTVCCDIEFSATSQLSKVYTRNLAAIKALQQLCDAENKFVERKRNDNFPSNFANEIYKYVQLCMCMCMKYQI